MQNNQEWNALVPSTAMPADEFVTGRRAGRARAARGKHPPALLHESLRRRGRPAAVQYPEQPRGSRVKRTRLQADLRGPGQLSLRKAFGPHTLSMGAYFANYTQDNHWNFTQILTDVARQPALPRRRRHGPRRHSEAGHEERIPQLPVRLRQRRRARRRSSPACSAARFSSPTRLRADLGGRVEYDDFVQSAENTSTFDLDGDSTTTFDNETFGNGSFRHFEKSITDWAGSLGLNYKLNDNLSLYAAGCARLQDAGARRVPERDRRRKQVDLFEARKVQSLEGGVKGVIGPAGLHGERLLDQERRTSSVRGSGRPGDRRNHLDHRHVAREQGLRCRDRGGR